MAFENQRTSQTLPDGAGPGEPRIELDGDAGVITLVGANENNKLILNPDSPDGSPLINIQNDSNPGDTETGWGYGGTGPETIGEEYISGANGNLVRSYLRMDQFRTLLGIFNQGSPNINGGIVELSDSTTKLRYGLAGVDLTTIQLSNTATDITSTELRVNGLHIPRGMVGFDEQQTDSAALGPAETIVLTVTNCVFTAGRAYEVLLGGRLRAGSVGTVTAQIHKTNIAGAIWGTYGTQDITTIGINYPLNGRLIVRRTAATDLTATVVATMQKSAGTFIHIGPRFFEIRDIGSASLYPNMLAVT